MTQSACLHIVLAAGEGTRMRSTKPKVMHEIARQPMLGHVLSAICAADAGADIAVVVGPGHDTVEGFLTKSAPDTRRFVQSERLGTAHAVSMARDVIAKHDGPVLVLFGDTPFVRPDSIARMAETIRSGADMTVVGFEADDPTGYGRLLMNGDQLAAIREHRDASEAERAVTLCNGGLMGFRAEVLMSALDRIGNDNAKGEFYLTDAVEIVCADGGRCEVVVVPESEILGINTRAQLADAEAVMQERLREAVMTEGVTLQDPASVYFAFDTMIGQDVEIEPHVVFGPGVRVGAGSVIRAFSHLEGVEIGARGMIGPFARLRPGARLKDGVKIGNFVEVKSAVIGTGAKVNHLSYIGDASLGAGANIGAGTITCNYDGFTKHLTQIGEDAFVGSNSALVAPVAIGKGAIVAAGSVITKTVPDDALGVGRSRQTNREDWAAAFREKKSPPKDD